MSRLEETKNVLPGLEFKYNLKPESDISRDAHFEASEITNPK